MDKENDVAFDPRRQFYGPANTNNGPQKRSVLGVLPTSFGHATGTYNETKLKQREPLKAVNVPVERKPAPKKPLQNISDVHFPPAPTFKLPTLGFTVYRDESEETSCSQHEEVLPEIVSPMERGSDSTISCSMQSQLSLDKNDESMNDVSMKEDEEVVHSGVEYEDFVVSYLTELEKKHRAKPHYMVKQPDITPSMRTILVDWLVEVSEEYKLTTETLYLAANYVDRFLSLMSVIRSKLQLVGTAALFVASKYEEIYPPDVSEFVYITDDTYTKKQVLRMEHLILKVLAFDLAVATPLNFIYKLCKVGNADNVTLHMALYLSELTLLDVDLCLRYLPSNIAASSVCLANLILGRPAWSSEMQAQCGYSYETLKESMELMYQLYRKMPDHQQQAIPDKYKTPKWSCVAMQRAPDNLCL